MFPAESGADQRRVRGVLALAVALLAPLAAAQIPDTFKNLQVLPKDISKRELVGTMRGWAGSLGVRCMHCHVGPDNLEGMDFASDEKATKRAAREMLRMLQAFNSDLSRAVPAREGTRSSVTCLTCHRRASRPPLPIEDELLRAAQAKGAAGVLERYAELRREHYGDGRYDFSPPSVGRSARTLAADGRVDAGLALARMGAEQQPETALLHVVHGELLKLSGDPDAAAAAFRKALALDPQDAAARRALAELEAPPKP